MINLTVTSPAFEQGGPIPLAYTADGRDISPPLAWGEVPLGTLSIAIICEDPVAHGGNWVHWIVFNIPVGVHQLPEGLKAKDPRWPHLKMGVNSFGNTHYCGPAPPRGLHHYHFQVFALNAILKLHGGANKSALQHAMVAHILARGELVGTYERHGTNAFSR